MKVELQAVAESCEELYAKFWQVDFEYGTTPGRYLVTYTYEFRGERHFDTFESAVPYEKGEVFAISIDPDRPYRSLPSVMEPSWKFRVVQWSVTTIVAGLVLYIVLHFHLEDH